MCVCVFDCICPCSSEKEQLAEEEEDGDENEGEVECRSGAELSVSPRQHEKRNGTVCGRSQIDVCGPPQSHPGKATLTFNTFNQ